MAISGRSVRKLRESAGAGGFAEQFRSMFIVEDEKGEATTRGASASPDEVSVRELAESLVGSEWVHDLHRGDLNSTVRLKEIGLREAAGALTPSNFSDINAFNAAVAGLLEAKILAAYKRPAFIGDQVVETVPTRINGGKMVGTGSIGDVAKPTLPGEEFPSVGLPTNWIVLPENIKHALKLALTREAVVYDYTQTLYEQASACGGAIGYRKEVRIADAVQGITNNYNRKGVPSNTYLTSGLYTNSLTNALTNQQSVDLANQLLMAQVDPETGLEILIENNPVMIVPPALAFTARAIARSTTLEFLPGGGANGTTRFFADNTINPPYDVVSSQIWYNRLLAAGVSATNAKGRWVYGDTKKAFAYMEVWPLTVRQAEVTSMEMISRDILNLWAASEYGQIATREPRVATRNTVE